MCLTGEFTARGLADMVADIAYTAEDQDDGWSVVQIYIASSCIQQLRALIGDEALEIVRKACETHKVEWTEELKKTLSL